MRFIAALVAALALVSCSRDPNVVKKRYLENGNKYFDRAKYKEARIMYRNAVNKDKLYGPAYYKLALTELKLGQVVPALNALRRAAELLPASSLERTDANVKIAEIYLIWAAGNKQYQDESETIAQGLLKRDANSYDGHRLMGELSLARAVISFRTGKTDAGKELVRNGIAEFRKANAIKPGETAAMLGLARALSSDQQYAEAEQMYKSLIAKEKTLLVVYDELYLLYLGRNNQAEAEKTLKLKIQNNPKQYQLLAQLASFYFGTRRRDDMVRVLNQMKSHAKEWPEAYVTAGDFYLRVGDADEAIRQYKEAMVADPKRKAVYQKHTIEALLRHGKLGAAVEINDAILTDNPKDTDARGLKASMLLDKGDVLKAVTELQSVVTADPKNFVARYNLGRAFLAKGEPELARQQFNEAIQARPDYLPARKALAQLQVRRSEFEPAMKSAAEILALDPQNLSARLVQSASLMGMGKYAESRQILQNLLIGQPNSVDVLTQLALLSMSEGKHKEAEDTFRKLYQLNPADPRGLLGLTEAYMAESKPELAIQLLQAEIQKNPKRLELRAGLANLAVRAGNFDLALREFQTALAAADQNSKLAGDLYHRIGEVYRLRGDYANSIGNLQKARQLLPDNSLVISTLALTLDAAGRRPEARQAYEQAVKIDPRNGAALNNLAFLLAETGSDLDTALTYAQRAKQLMPRLNEVQDTMGWIYLKKNLSDNAIEIFRELVSKEPKHSTYRYHLGLALSQKGDKLKALEELRTALQSNPPKGEADQIRALIQKLG